MCNIFKLIKERKEKKKKSKLKKSNALKMKLKFLKIGLIKNVILNMRKVVK